MLSATSEASENLSSRPRPELGVDEVIHFLIDVMYAKTPYKVISRTVRTHPTAELVPTTLKA